MISFYRERDDVKRSLKKRRIVGKPVGVEMQFRFGNCVKYVANYCVSVEVMHFF